MLTAILYFLFVHLTLLLPGYTLVVNLRWFRIKPAIELCAAYLASLLTFGVLAMLGYILHLPLTALTMLSWMLLLGGLFFFFKQNLYRDLLDHRFVLAAFLAMSLFSCLIISLTYSAPLSLIPDVQPMPNTHYDTLNTKVLNVAQTNANDNYIPYRQAQFIINRSNPGKDSFISEWGVDFFQRTPLMGAVTAEYFTLLRDKPPVDFIWSNTASDPSHTYLKFQILAQTLNCLLIIPGYFLIIRLFNRKTARLAAIFIIPNHFFLYNAFFSWPKSLVAFFILSSWLFILEKRFRYLILAAIASGGAYLTHDLAILYIGASFLLLLYYKRFRDLLVFTAINIVMALPWLLTSALVFNKSSSFIYFPFSTHGIPQAEHKDQIFRDFFKTSLFQLIYIRLHSLFYLLAPYQVIVYDNAQTIGRHLWAASIFNIPGAVGLGLIFATVGGIIKKIRNLPFWILSLAPAVLCVLVIGWQDGVGALHFAEASVILFIGLGAWFLTTIRRFMWAALVGMANIIQLVWFVLYSFNFEWSKWFIHPRDLAILTLLVAIIGLCGWAFYRIWHSRPLLSLKLTHVK